MKLEVKKPFGNLFRKRCVLIAAQDSQGHILIGAKPHFYPPTISRMLGGGVDDGESFEQATLRELEEELGVKLEAGSLTPLVLFETSATDEDGNEYYNETAVFGANIGDRAYHPGDDVTHIIRMTPDEVHELGERYEQLPDVLWYFGEEGLYAWADYAKLYGPVHKVTADKIEAAGL
ncbi:NUDIX hydrolase [Nocardia abscessus]|uniref:NUDIX hydrolase n=1 Tax=Nocardia abscessus TaxID=120957 RepID=UPI002457B2BE|nr:NUDIX hydrolase [Nocardia abscessus]